MVRCWKMNRFKVQASVYYQLYNCLESDTLSDISFFKIIYLAARSWLRYVGSILLIVACKIFSYSLWDLVP